MFHVKHLGTIERKGAAVPEKIVLTRDLEHDPILSDHAPANAGTLRPRRHGRALSAMAIASAALISSNNKRAHSSHNRGSTRNSRPLPARKEP